MYHPSSAKLLRFQCYIKHWFLYKYPATLHRVSPTMSMCACVIVFDVLHALQPWSDTCQPTFPFASCIATLQITSNSRKTWRNMRHVHLLLVLLVSLILKWTAHIVLSTGISRFFSNVYSVQSYLCQKNHCFLVIHNTCLSPADSHCCPVIPQILADSGHGGTLNPSVMCGDCVWCHLSLRRCMEI